MVLLKHINNEVKLLKDEAKDLEANNDHQQEVIDVQIEKCFNLNYKAPTIEDMAQQDKETWMGRLEEVNEEVFTFKNQ